jgi:tape measure domain-containing protein
MTDIAQLGFSVDTKALENGAKKMKSFEQQSDSLDKTWTKLFEKLDKISTLLERYSKISDKATKTTKTLSESTNKTANSFKDFTSSLKYLGVINAKVENGLNAFAKAMLVNIKLYNKTVDAINSVKKASQSLLLGLKKMIGLFFNLKSVLIGLGFGLLAKNFLDAAASAERLRIRLDAFTKGQGAEYFDKLNQWAALLPVNTEEAVQVFTKLQAYGLEPTTKLMTTLVDTVTALGGEADSLSGIARALGQIETKGRVSAEEINQLAEQGVNARKYLMEAFSLIPSDFNEIDAAVRKTGHTTTQAIEAIIKGMDKEFGGMAERIKNSWQGLTNRMIHQWFNFRRIVMEKGIFQFIKGKLQEFLEFLESPEGTKAMENWAKKISDTVFDAAIFMVKSIETVVSSVGGIADEIERLGRIAKGMPFVGDDEYKAYKKAKEELESIGDVQGKINQLNLKYIEAINKEREIIGDMSSRKFAIVDKDFKWPGSDEISKQIDDLIKKRMLISEYEAKNPLWKESEESTESFGDKFRNTTGKIISELEKYKKEFEGGIFGKDGIVPPKSKQNMEILMRVTKEYGDLLDTFDPKRKMFRDYEEDLDLLVDAYVLGLIPSQEKLLEQIRLLKLEYSGLVPQSWMDGISESLRKYIETSKDIAGQVGNAFTNAFNGMEDALVDFVTTGKASFTDFANSVLRDIARIVVRQSIMTPIAQGVGAMFGGGYTTDYSIPMTSSGYHSGGIVGSESSFSRNVNSSIFNNAPKYHNGGLVGGEVPAILKRGEGVFTPEQMKALGATNIQIIDQRSSPNSSQISTEESSGADGQRLVRVLVRDEVRSGLTNGSFDKTLKGNMGLSRRPIRR